MNVAEFYVAVRKLTEERQLADGCDDGCTFSATTAGATWRLF
ncbi:hypothetical protein ID866_9319 [Astraeus odoratus]|nr:hypothetical protein ID866_9319 [Astraeus odoratus]